MERERMSKEGLREREIRDRRRGERQHLKLNKMPVMAIWKC